MKKSIITAIALGLAFLPLAGGAYAQPCGPNANRQCDTSNTTPSLPTPVVCFYTATNFKGQFFCETGVRSVSTVPALWRNKIKSITVGDHTTVRLCPADVLQGDCTVIGEDVSKLQRGLYNRVRSYDIRQVY